MELMTFEEFNEKYEGIKNALGNLLAVMTECAFDYGFSIRGKLSINNKEQPRTNIGIEQYININID